MSNQSSRESSILITATSLDEHAYAPVQRSLESRGATVVVYRTDKVLTGEDRFLVDISDGFGLSMSYGGVSINPDDVGAAWYRKVAAFSIGSPYSDHAKQLHISKEVADTHDSIWPLYPDEVWLNSPDKMRAGGRKVAQLLLAKELGFAIPRTIIASEWSDIAPSLLSDSSPMIVKMIRGIISEGEVMKAL